MVSIVAKDARPYRGELLFLIEAEEARDLLEILRRAADYPGRRRRLKLAPTTQPNYRPEWSRRELLILADPDAVCPVAFADLSSPCLRVVIRPDEETRLHEALRRVIVDEWDRSWSFPILDPVEHPKLATITVTFL